MTMRTGRDALGRRIGRVDHLHFITRADDTPDPHAQAAHDAPLVLSTDIALVTGDTELWEIQERRLGIAHIELDLPPGVYTVTTHANFSGRKVGEITREMPLPLAYARLGRSPRNGLPARSFVHTVLAAYPGSTLAHVAEHVTEHVADFHARPNPQRR
jgi:hypothetical protein